MLLAAALSADQPALAEQIISIWNGGAGNWNTAAGWTPVVVPNNGGGNTYDVRIDGGNAAASNVTLNISPTIDLLTVDALDSLTIPNAYNLTVAGGGIANAGTVALSAGGSYADLRISGSDLTLSGGGTVAFSNSLYNRILSMGSAERLINVDNTIRGAGQVGANAMALTNRGTIQADQTNPLTINPNTAGGATNSGTMWATAGGTLILSGGTFTNFEGATQGLIRADGATGKSIVKIENSTVTGGRVDVVGGGEIQLASATVSGGSLTNSSAGIVRAASGTSTLGGTVTNPVGGQIIVDSSYILTLQSSGTYSNAGTILLNSSGGTYSELKVSGGDVMLSGAGTVVMANNSTYNGIIGAGGLNDRLINADNLIRGSGHVGWNTMSLVNRGTIQAGLGDFLTVDPKIPGGATNSGTMQATAGGTLVLSGGTFTNFEGTTQGLIRADASTVRIENSTVTGGQLDVVGGGEIRLASSTVSGGSLMNSSTGIVRAMAGVSTLGGAVTNPVGGQIIVDNSGFLILQSGGTYTNAGMLTLNGGGSYTELKVSGGDVTLSGGGTVVMANNSAYNVILAVGNPNDRLVNADNLIRGSGQIGWNTMALVNRGTIQADQTNSLTIYPNSAGGATNSGTMRATAGATLILSNGVFTNFEGTTPGLIQADASTVRVDYATVTGGRVEVVGSGEIRLASATVSGGSLTNSSTGVVRAMAGLSTLGGTVTNPVGGQIIVDNSGTLTLKNGGTYSNAGTLTLNSGGSYTNLKMSGGDVTLSGGGTVAMSNSSINVITGTAGTERLINADNLIRGSGQIGWGTMALTNRGTIQADQTNYLTIYPYFAAGAINSGTMRATAGATLILSNGTFTNFEGATPGLIRADASTVKIDNATVTGGQVDVVGGGEIRLSYATVSGGSLTNSGTGVVCVAAGPSTLGGTVTNPVGGQILVENSGTLTLQSGGTYTNAGTLTLNGGVSYTYLKMSGGDVTLSGGGAVVMANNSVYNSILGTVPADRLINADNTIRGAGTISGLLTNRGTVDATGVLYLNTYAKINDGTFRASPGGTLMVDIGTSGTGRWEAAGGKIQVGSVTVSTTGPISVTAGGELELNGSTISGSNLTMDPSGVIDVNSVLALSGNLSFAMTDEAKWDWGTTATLAMNGGGGAAVGHWADWVSLEVGGTDFGTDPATHAGAAAGFSANFDLTKLTIGPGAHVYLADLFDNGNRGGAYGQA
ncbi:MAG: hypothetical protein NTY65_04195, partial [Planctomycetota bacterium]|nr:hypothetical protein [Planctomycetota bacterium]